MCMTPSWSLLMVLGAGLMMPVACAAQTSSAQNTRAPRTTNAVNTRAAAGTSTPAWSKEDFKLGPGDKLRIDVYRDEQMSQNVQIRPDGKVTLPQVGEVVAAGLTAQELDDTLTAALKKFIVDPVVTVIVQEATSAKFSVVGKVHGPGTFIMTGPMEVLEALAQAGDLTDFAKRGDIHIQRTVGSQVLTIPVDYRRLMRGESAPVFLQPGDRLVVP
jgi:polysaccharide export outer membrane protein